MQIYLSLCRTIVRFFWCANRLDQWTSRGKDQNEITEREAFTFKQLFWYVLLTFVFFIVRINLKDTTFQLAKCITELLQRICWFFHSRMIYKKKFVDRVLMLKDCLKKFFSKISFHFFFTNVNFLAHPRNIIISTQQITERLSKHVHINIQGGGRQDLDNHMVRCWNHARKNTYNQQAKCQRWERPKQHARGERWGKEKTRGIPTKRTGARGGSQPWGIRDWKLRKPYEPHPVTTPSSTIEHCHQRLDVEVVRDIHHVGDPTGCTLAQRTRREPSLSVGCWPHAEGWRARGGKPRRKPRRERGHKTAATRPERRCGTGTLRGGGWESRRRHGTNDNPPWPQRASPQSRDQANGKLRE